MPGTRIAHLFVALGLAAALPACASTPVTRLDRQEVRHVVERMFQALDDQDEGAFRSLLAGEGTFVSVRRNVEGRRAVNITTFRDYLDNLGDGDRSWVERTWDETIHIDGDVAVVWTRYDFHIDGIFSHCGRDAFTLVKGPNGWRVASLAWTVESDCRPSPLGPLRLED